MKNQGENLRRDDSSIPLKKNKPTPVYLGYRLIIRSSEKNGKTYIPVLK